MRRLITFLLLLITLSGGALYAQQMTDDQVIQYVKEAQQQGKTQAQMRTELLQRGVTAEQVERIRAKYEQSQTPGANTQATTQQQRTRKPVDADDVQKNKNSQLVPVAPTAPDAAGTGNEEFQLPVDDFLLMPPVVKVDSKRIFGKDVFSNSKLTFEPNSNIATPENYRLGPGDEVIIDIWGDSENSIRDVISPDGSIMVKRLGPVFLSGMTVKEANAYLQREFSKIYSGLSENLSQVKLTLGQNRTIQVSIMGEVVVPGVYTLSSFSSVFHALYCAGGINSIGGLRSIELIRGGKKIADIDVYDYIMNGKTNDDIRLMEDDVILVHPFQLMVSISGRVKRPMYYEMKKGETVAALLKFAGGFAGDAYKQNVRLVRSNEREKQIFNVDEMNYSVFKLNDDDSLEVGAVLDRFENRVQIFGAVYRDGMYQMNGSVNTVKQLIQKAEGLRGDAFLDRAQIRREREDLSLEMVPLDLRGIMNGSTPDVPLQRNDIVYVPSIHDLNEEKMITIHGQVAYPGTYKFAEDLTIQDLVIQAGGLLEAASTARVDVSRRIKEPESTEQAKTTGIIFSFDLKKGLIIDGKPFQLQPFDEVYIRKSPAYQKQQNVSVNGEILFNGNYALTKKNERLSDLVNKAGGITDEAYVKGARLVRKMTEEELRRKNDLLRMTQQAGDSVSIKSLDLAASYPVGINLRMALDHPGSEYDLVLREGDLLFIPEYNNTVKINGAVMYPNTVFYKANEGYKYYLNQAGGYGDMARKRRAYVVYMNGTVARLKSNDSKLIEPGCEIVIPSKSEKKRMSTAEIISMGTSVTSLAAMVATLVNVFKK